MLEFETEFPFIRFTNWKQGVDILSDDFIAQFPFIRFTNWKQERELVGAQKETEKVRFHSYASRIGSKYDEKDLEIAGEWIVSIHTLHELEARNPNGPEGTDKLLEFPFIRFTNWKQGGLFQWGIWAKEKLFPFIRFTNWKQVLLIGSAAGVMLWVSIHTLHELEASISDSPKSGERHSLKTRFHSYASRIGSKPCPTAAKRPRNPRSRFHSYASRIGSKNVNLKTGEVFIPSFHSYASRIGSK